MKNSVYLLFVLLALFSCKEEDRVMDENIVISEMEWHQDSVVAFDVVISDETKEYNLFLNIRNGLDYPFRNIYFLYSIENEKGNLIYANQKELFLFDKQGRPIGSADSFLGVSYGDLYDSSNQFAKYQFPKSGTYRINIAQNMRNTPVLAGVMSVGIKITE